MRNKKTRRSLSTLIACTLLTSTVLLPFSAFAEAPTISDISPNTGPTAGGTAIIITGTGFATDTAVTIGGNAATVSATTTTTINATTPTGTAGPADVVVTGNGSATTSVGGFTFTEASSSATSTPTLNSIEITSPPTALSYFIGDALNLDGLVVTGTYSDTTTSEVPVTISNISDFDNSIATTSQTVTVTVDGKTATFIVHILPKVLSLTATSSNDEGVTGTISDDTNNSLFSNGVNVFVDFSGGTVATGTSAWDGKILFTGVASSTFTITPSSGKTATPVAAIEIGAGDIPLLLSQPAKITFVDQAGKLAGWSQGGVFTPISTVCDSATTTPTLSTGTSTGARDCSIDVSSDLVVWTTHLTTFIAYSESAIPVSPSPSPSPAPSGNSGNGPIAGSLGGGSLIPGNPIPAPTTTPILTPLPNLGQVLGASTYNFTMRLAFGSRGDEVTALQNALTQHGFYSGPITGYFGLLTQAAVKSFQSSNGIAAIGVVGPQTRAALNSLGNSADSARQALIAALMQKLQQLLAQINILKGGTATSTPPITSTSTPPVSTTTPPIASTSTATTTTTY